MLQLMLLFAGLAEFSLSKPQDEWYPFGYPDLNTAPDPQTSATTAPNQNLFQTSTSCPCQDVLTKYQEDIKSLRDDLTAEKEKGAKLEDKVANLTKAVESLNEQLLLMSGECSRVKTNLVEFFNSVTEGNKPKPLPNSDDKTGNEGNVRVSLTLNSTGGVSYVRWGRTVCNADARILYNGYAVQKRNNLDHPGSDYLCLHSTPQWGEGPLNSLQNWSTLSGVEYGTFQDWNTFSNENINYQPLDGNDMPCTVCQVDTRSNQLMIPGRKSCPTGWTLEYWGYLVTSRSSNSGHPFLCLDQAPEGVASGSSMEGTAPVYAVEVYCQALPCPPYVEGYEITCAVCSK